MPHPTLPGLDPHELAHRDDPRTSTEAAAANAVRRGSQRRLLLAAFASAEGGLTYDEAGAAAGVGGYNERRRCSELRQLGLIAWHGTTRPGASGSSAMVCTITLAGMVALQASRRDLRH
jgi:hypothetical protein